MQERERWNLAAREAASKAHRRQVLQVALNQLVRGSRAFAPRPRQYCERCRHCSSDKASPLFNHTDNGSLSYLTLTCARANPQMRPPIAKVLPRESGAA